MIPSQVQRNLRAKESACFTQEDVLNNNVPEGETCSSKENPAADAECDYNSQQHDSSYIEAKDDDECVDGLFLRSYQVK